MSKEKGGNGGCIVNIASAAGITTTFFMMPIYSASKFAVVGFTRSMAVSIFYCH